MNFEVCFFLFSSLSFAKLVSFPMFNRSCKFMQSCSFSPSNVQMLKGGVIVRVGAHVAISLVFINDSSPKHHNFLKKSTTICNESHGTLDPAIYGSPGSLSAARDLDLILASRDGIGELIGLGFNLFGINVDCGVYAYFFGS